VRELISRARGSSHHDFVSSSGSWRAQHRWIAPIHAGTAQTSLDIHPALCCCRNALNRSVHRGGAGTLKAEKFCLIVVAEGIVDRTATYVAGATRRRDAFDKRLSGHAANTCACSSNSSSGCGCRRRSWGWPRRGGALRVIDGHRTSLFCAAAAVRAAVAGEIGQW